MPWVTTFWWNGKAIAYRSECECGWTGQLRYFMPDGDPWQGAAHVAAFRDGQAHTHG